MITLGVTQKRLYGSGTVLKNTWGGLLLMVLQVKMFLVLPLPYAEFFVLKGVLQRCSSTNVFWKYAAGLLESTHAKA